LVLQSSLLYHALQSGHRVNLVAHLDGTKFEVQQRLQLLQKDLCQKFTANEAMKKAYQAIDYSVMKQSTVLSYMDIFYI
jgi:DHA2 family multidrug resistance protein